MSYIPNQPPNNQANIPEYLVQELLRISDAVHEPTVSNVNYETIHVIPAKLIPGMTVNFAADVLALGSVAGLHEYVDSTIGWQPLVPDPAVVLFTAQLALPAIPRDGMLMLFAAGVANPELPDPVSPAGLYIYSEEQSKWIAL